MPRQMRLMLFAGLSILFAGCATVPPGQQPDVKYTKNDVYLKDACRRYDIVWDWDQVTQIVTLRKGDMTATALIDSDLVLLGEKQIVLRKPLRLKKGAIVIPKDFHEKVLVLLNTGVVTPKDIARSDRPDTDYKRKPVTPGSYRIEKIREVIIDAGHGGKDPGAMGQNKSREKDIVLDISKRVKRILERQGIKVYMTRDDDNFITLQDRTEIASKTKADAFISIHANSSPKRSVSGIEVFALRNLTQAEKEDENRRINKKIFLSHLATNPKDKNIESIVEDLMYEYKQSESLKLARSMGENLSRTLRANNRGTKTAGFYVLRNTFIPAVLVEVGFVSNAKEERLLKSDSYRDKIAKSIANSLLDYSRGK
ncbi:MAG: N-acetylmuramoyl-L-alanine amidase [Candidatus Omnitrophota bacterium]